MKHYLNYLNFFFTGGSIAYVYCFDISVFIQGKMLIMAKQASQIELGVYRAFLLFNPEGSLRYQCKLDSGTAALDKPPSASTSLGQASLVGVQLSSHG